MTIDRGRLDAWLQRREDEHCEFKRASNGFDSRELCCYCIALANEGGGCLILGVGDATPREVVGSQACQDLEREKHQLLQRLHFRVDATALDYDGRRVVVFKVPSRPAGTPLQLDGAYWMRSGESLTPMTPERLQEIFNESGPDYSATTSPTASIADLDPAAIERLRSLWARKGGGEAIADAPHERLLADAELLTPEGRLPLAALLLLGSESGVRKHLPQAELIYEYRGADDAIPAQHRLEFRRGYLGYDDLLWNQINLRNERQQVRDGMFINEFQAFNEEVVREALLNAVCHRDYRLGESILIRQFPRRLEVESPGGFASGVTPENILDRQFRRNRLVAEVLQKCGLIERSGQGADKMFRLMIQESKPRPDYTGSDAYRVLLSLHAEIQDPQFLRYLERVGRERGRPLPVHDLVLLDDIRRGSVRAADARVRRLVEHGFIERISRGKGTRYILSKRYYTVAGERGVYTRKRGLDRETHKALILKHLEMHEIGTIQEFEQLLPSLTRNQIHALIKELRKEGRVVFVGSRHAGHYERPRPNP